MEFIEQVKEMSEDEKAALYEDFTNVADFIWNNDANACLVDQDFGIDLGGRTRYNEEEDQAEEPLFSWVSEDLINRPTYLAFLHLMDNYASETGISEDISETEIEEQWNFLDAICKTDVIYNLHHWLVSKELAPEDMEDFKEKLNNLWFNMYGRSYDTRKRRTEDSSAFEHIFVGETRDGEILGFHNWLRFYQLEKRGIIDYKGYYPKYGHEEDPQPVSVTIKFECSVKGIDMEKPKGGFLLGTSPEFEIALYTAGLILSGGENAEIPIKIGDYDLNLKVYCTNGRFLSAFCV